MPDMRLLIGGPIPRSLLPEIVGCAVSDRYCQRHDGQAVGSDLLPHFERCAVEGRPIDLLITDFRRADYATLSQPGPRLHTLLGWNQIRFRSFVPPGESSDGEIEIFCDALGCVSIPATMSGDPLLTASEIEFQRKSLGLDDAEVLQYLVGRLAALREPPPPAVLTCSETRRLVWV